MKTLSIEQIEQVSGGIGASEQFTFQSTLVGAGLAIAATGVSLTPVGAAILIGTSVAATASYIYDNWNDAGNGGGGTSAHYRSSIPAEQVKQS